ncbi:hypothetical protein K2173_015780 [Erythroxylum novogranatense]|uniref:DUF4283 domain-containing protein n=1 Tax=Erythroxylum novogranatense TaxID=1862640 RepID=A0AAV8SEE4_9ROSI|nr:hypothetical protein K2173_015780 [Erythroxylum novogranatense]
MEATAGAGQTHKRVRTSDSEEEAPIPSPQTYRAVVLGTQALATSDTDWPEDEVIATDEGDITVSDDSGGGITLSASFKHKLDAQWKHAVLLSKCLASLWHPHGPMRVVDLDFDYYLVRFKKEEDCMAALTQRPWVIFGHVLSAQPWQPTFRPLHGMVTHAVVWVRVLNLPITRYHPHILTAVGNLVAHIIRIDVMMMLKLRGKYARLAVDVDLASPLHRNVELDGETLLLEYEGLPQLCFAFGRIGHVESAYPHASPPPPVSGSSAGIASMPEATAPSPGAPVMTPSSPGYGEWTQVTRKGPCNSQARRGANGRDQSRPHQGGSRFDVLARQENIDALNASKSVGPPAPQPVGTWIFSPNTTRGSTSRQVAPPLVFKTPGLKNPVKLVPKGPSAATTRRPKGAGYQAPVPAMACETTLAHLPL